VVLAIIICSLLTGYERVLIARTKADAATSSLLPLGASVFSIK
jgi:hypothetical protein